MQHIEVKANFTVTDEGIIEGVAWPFGAADRMGDEINPGAFSKTAGPLPMLAFHDQAETVGVWESITETAQGLVVKGRLLIEHVARAKEILALVKAKALPALSIGFQTRKAAPRKGGGRIISELDLLEISIVAVGMHPGARITSAKGLDMENQEQVHEQGKPEAKPEISELKTEMKSLADTVGKIDTKALADRLDKLEAKANRPAGKGADPEGDNIEKKAFNSFIRNGASALDEAERKALNIGTPAAGGYVTAPEYSTTIIEKIEEYSPMRRLSSVMTIGATEVYLPKLATRLQGNWVTETGARPESEPTFEQQNIKVFEHAVIVPVSQQLLEDSFIDLQSYLAGQIGQQFGKAENTAYLLGDGNGKPTGLLNTPADYEAVDAANDGSDVVAKLIELYYALPSAYARNASWLMNRKTMALIRGTLDATDRMIWGDSLATGQPPTLLGRPVVEAPDMADFGTDTFPVAFGDFKAAYQIVDRVNVQIMRDDYTGADNGIVKIRARRRTGGAPVLEEAVALLKSAGA